MNTTRPTYTPGLMLAREGDTMNTARTWGLCVELSAEEHGCDPADGMRTSVVAEVFDRPDDKGEADARRFAAVWNACAGIPTEALETHGPGCVAAFAARALKAEKSLEKAHALIGEFLGVIDMSNPEHEDYADSCADTVQALCELEDEARTLTGHRLRARHQLRSAPHPDDYTPGTLDVLKTDHGDESYSDELFYSQAEALAYIEADKDEGRAWVDLPEDREPREAA